MSYLSEDAKKIEASYQNDMRKLYRIHARRARLLGIWAAEKMYIFGDKATDYAVSIVMADHAEADGEGMRKKIEVDFQNNNTPFDLQEYADIYSKLLIRAESEVLEEQDIYA